jgi:hypothetical protein
VFATLTPQTSSDVEVAVRFHVEVAPELPVSRLVLLRRLPSVRPGNRVVVQSDDFLDAIDERTVVLLPVDVHAGDAHPNSAAGRGRGQVVLAAIEEEGAVRVVSRIASSPGAMGNAVPRQGHREESSTKLVSTRDMRGYSQEANSLERVKRSRKREADGSARDRRKVSRECLWVCVCE